MSVFNKQERADLNKAAKMLEEAKGILDQVWEDAEARVSERSDKWKESEKGEEAQGQLSSLEDLGSTIEEAAQSISDLANEE